LGEFQVLIDDVQVSSFKSDKVRALLVYLAVESDCSHSREALMGLLWPDSPEETARHSLRQALFSLRLALGDHTAKSPYLLVSRDSIQFNLESDYSLDLEKFKRYFDTWERNREKPENQSLIPQLEEMVSLYHGEFLQHFYVRDSTEFEDWIVVRREALRQRLMDALIVLANYYERREEFEAARRYASRQLELDPWREDAHLQLMRVLAISGERSTALAQYEHCKKVLADELGVEPSAKVRDLYEQIRLGTLIPMPTPAAKTSSAPIHNLPVSLTPFVGREQELADLTELITNPDCRCITLVGPGGIGKTRLGLRVAEQQRSNFNDGVAFIPLVSVVSVEAAIPAIANGIGFSFYGPTDPKVQLLNYLRDKQMLLVVDNVEHLLDQPSDSGTIAELLIEILQQVKALKFLITSREALNIQEEWSFEIQGLAFPMAEEIDQFEGFDAIVLFIERARRRRPNWVMDEKDKAGIAHLCQMVEGMPLAIELAASWMRLMTPSQIAAEIEQSLDILDTQMRDVPERHRNMRAVFDRSWQMLSPEENQVLNQLSVFRGGFQREAAEQVAGSSLKILSSLVVRSLLRHTANGRYELHELIRQYAASKLETNPQELQAAQERHSHYYMSLLEKRGEALRSNHQKESLSELTIEMDNIRAAWQSSVAKQTWIPLHRASTTLWYFFELRNWFREGELTFWDTAEALRAFIESSESQDIVQQAVMHLMVAHSCSFKLRQGKSEEAYRTLTPSVAFLRTCSDPIAAIYSQGYLGVACWELGKFSDAKESLQASRELARAYGDRWYEALMDEFLGVVSYDQGDYHQAQQYLSEAASIFRQLGDPSFRAHVLSYLGRTMQELGKYQEAENLLQEGLTLTRESGYRFATGLALDALGQVAYAQGHHEEASARFTESANLFRDMSDSHRLSRTLNHQGLNFLALNQSDDAQKAFLAALSLASERGLVPVELYALSGLAALETRQQASQRTLELVLYILQHPASDQETKNWANRLRAELESKLSREEIDTVEQSTGTEHMGGLVHHALDDL
jgi:predicted ATPase/DNA-binding SARP family transcriptional activator